MHGTCLLTLFVSIGCFVGVLSGSAQEIDQPAKADPASTIAHLISQLGDSQYPTREKAQ